MPARFDEANRTSVGRALPATFDEANRASVGRAMPATFDEANRASVGRAMPATFDAPIGSRSRAVPRHRSSLQTIENACKFMRLANLRVACAEPACAYFSPDIGWGIGPARAPAPRPSGCPEAPETPYPVIPYLAAAFRRRPWHVCCVSGNECPAPQSWGRGHFVWGASAHVRCERGGCDE